MKPSSLMGEKIFITLTALCTLVAIGTLAFLLVAILKGGWERLDLAFLTVPTNAGPSGGGIAYQILGSVVLLSATAAIVTPCALSLALLACFLLKNAKTAKKALMTLLHVLNATPSIIFGIMGFIIFMKMFGWEKSWLAGALILSMMILPTVTVAVIERLETIPTGYIETARSLGLNDEYVLRSVLLPHSWGGLLTGLVMGLARAAGETAPIMFTAVVFSGATMPQGIVDSPVLALPYHIFNLAQDIYGPDALATAWATASVLVGLVILVNIAAIPLRVKCREEARQ